MALTFRDRLLLGITLLIVSFVAGAAAVVAELSGRFAREQAEQKVAEGRASFTAQLLQRREALRNETAFLARTPLLLATAAIPGVDAATFSDPFDELQTNFPSGLLAVVDARGRLVAQRGGPWEPGQDLSALPGLQAALAGETTEQAWPLPGGLALVGIAPLAQAGELHGVLIRGDAVDTPLAHQLGIVVGCDVLLLADGRLVGEHWHVAPGDVDRSVVQPLRHAGIPSTGLPFDVLVDGERRRGVALQLHPAGGVAILLHNLDALAVLQAETRWWLVLVGGVLTLVGIGFAAGVTRRLSRRLQVLVEAADRMGRGDLGSRVAEADFDRELGRLAESFNAMADTVQTLILDVTDKASRAEAASRAKDGFLTSISHELRTPLTGIQTTAELLQSFGDQTTPAERDEFLTTILREAERLGRRIGDALEFANLSSGTTRWTLGRVDLQQIAAQAWQRLHGLQALKRVGIAIRAEADGVLQGDREHLTQALFHLLHNAWTWSPAGEQVEVRILAAGDGLAVEVADRGPGVPAHERQRVFESFTQGGDVLVDKPQGIGIGLKIASEIAMRHGGGVAYEDRAGGGALFRLTVRRSDRPIDQLVAAEGNAAAPA